MQASTLFVCDTNGRLRFIREPGYEEPELDPAPRFWMGRTLEGNVCRFRYDLSADLVRDLEQICRSEPPAANVAELPLTATTIRAALHAQAPIMQEQRGPAYWIPDNIHVPRVQVVLVSEANAYLLKANFPWKQISPSGVKTGPLVAAVAGGSAVSICYCARLTAVAAEAGVKTVESARGHGYAGAAVAGWASAVRQCGLLPLYSTSWANVASWRVARKLGMVCYGEDWSIT